MMIIEWHLPGRTEGNHEKLQSRYLVSRPRSDFMTFQIWSKSVTYLSVMYSVSYCILSSSVTGFIVLQWLKLWSVTYAAGTHLITKMVVATTTNMITRMSVLQDTLTRNVYGHMTATKAVRSSAWGIPMACWLVVLRVEQHHIHPPWQRT